MTHPVVIDNITIKQDAQGRFCLNDLHKAAVFDAAVAVRKASLSDFNSHKNTPQIREGIG